MSVPSPGRLRLAELTSGAGALVLGLGLGALAGKHLEGFGLPLLAAGAAVHGWGMLDKHRLERRADRQTVWWEPIAYWTCWVLLGVLAIGIAGRPSGLI
jgi:hypothetical protein